MLYQYFYNMILNNLIFFFALFVFSMLFNKYFLVIIKKYNLKLLIDDQFKKPQAFHEFATPLSGGTGILFSLAFVFLYLFLFKNLSYFEYIFFCMLFFFLGFLDDLKISLRPKIRLILMIIILIIAIHYNNFYIAKTGIEILNIWLNSSNIFSLIFVCLCFLFVVNGANLIEGYNGLLGFHSLIIILNLFFINYFNQNYDLAILLFCVILILIVFLMFNFPRARLFLGDGGSYLLGSFIAISVIETSMSNPEISPFYFCILLYYLFIEVFFSFIRKFFTTNAHPLVPDKKHLHMLLYNILITKGYSKFKSNYFVSIILNSAYLLLILPSILFMENGMFCKYYSLIIILTYILSYNVVYKKNEI